MEYIDGGFVDCTGNHAENLGTLLIICAQSEKEPLLETDLIFERYAPNTHPSKAVGRSIKTMHRGLGFICIEGFYEGSFLDTVLQEKSPMLPAYRLKEFCFTDPLLKEKKR